MKTPIGPINDAQIARARELMATFNRAVGDDRGLRTVSEQIFAAAGVRRFEELLQRPQDADIGWRWLAAVSSTAVDRGDTQLPSEIFAFTTFWNDNIAPLLGPADWADLCLDSAPREIQAQTAAHALPCLVTFSPDHAVMGNATGQLTADLLVGVAAQRILELDGVDPSITPDLLSAARTVVEAPPLPASGSTERNSHRRVESPAGGAHSTPDDLIGRAAQQLDRVKDALTSSGLRFVDLGSTVMGVGLGIAWSDTDYVVLSVSGGLEDVLNLTAGILKDVTHDRLNVLNVCNNLTQNNSAYPFYLHDAEVGWDIHVQQRYPIDVLLAAPSFFRSCVGDLPTIAKEGRNKFIEAGVQGEPHTWNDEDLHRLLVRSML